MTTLKLETKGVVTTCRHRYFSHEMNIIYGVDVTSLTPQEIFWCTVIPKRPDPFKLFKLAVKRKRPWAKNPDSPIYQERLRKATLALEAKARARTVCRFNRQIAANYLARQ
ncbi:unnamed protein product [Orchesella dallaii]|uniref:Uncharacterized protein n=1 Tax=Orchesella dallaii TaxID=48710 RepID=A0ABP1Q9S6_9HEXA